MMGAQNLTHALGGKWYGGYGLAFCPTHENRQTPALSLKDGDKGKLLVHCFAGCDGAGVLAALRARGLIAVDGDRQMDPREAEQRRTEKKAQDRRRTEQARRCWHEAGSVANTLAERYLRARGITCDLPSTLRYHAGCWHGPTARKMPAMVAAVSVGRKLVGVHRTFLTEPGAKAFGPDSKLMLGHCAGGAVRLSGGPGPLVVAEVSRQRFPCCPAFRTPNRAFGPLSAPAAWPR